jgi:hypothetical protein
MTRSFPLFVKKKGERRTSSETLGSAGLTLFFAGMFLAGWCFLVVVLTVLALPEWRAQLHYQESPCTVLATRVADNADPTNPRYRPEVRIRYRVQQRDYEVWTYDVTHGFTGDRAAAEAQLSRFQIGQTYPCWYDPDRPQHAVVVRGHTGYYWLLALLALPFISTGLLGMISQIAGRRTSAERRQTMAQRTRERVSPAPLGDKLPAVPRPTNLTNSPGTRLAFRLPVVDKRGWALAALLGGCLVWNAVVSALWTLAVQALRSGKPTWPLLPISVAFTAVGVWLIAICLRELAHATVLGRTVVEIDDHPLRPGGRYAVLVAQFGRMRLESVRVSLVCEEHVTYQQGTNTRSETCRVYEAPLTDCQHVLLRPEAPWEAPLQVAIPADAMHSFQAPHNELAWKLLVEATPAGMPRVVRAFPLVVYPPHSGEAA